MSKSFSAQVSDWVKETEDRLERVTKESMQRVVSEMQKPVAAGGNMPVDTGFLRASIRASLSQMPDIDPASRPADGKKYPYEDAVSLTIQGMALGQTFYAGYVASYAAHQEYGSNGRAGKAFVRLAAQNWQQIVNQVSAEAKAAAPQ